MAVAAVDLISELIQEKTVRTGGILMHGELLVGRSTGPVPASAAKRT